ncbi:P-selectin-like [Emydura macquarii macquarii]|uniref:P-selectin-like n=1 Tax=Emydura macquarii macquarii TaxID=1129001 RepID=UPI00352B30A7
MAVGLCSSPREWGRVWSAAGLLCFAAISWVLVTQREVGAWTYHYGEKSDYSWELARNFCQSFYTDLVAIQNQKEIAYLNDVLPRHKSYYWIGIRRINNVWTWVGTKKALTKEAENWARREPNNRGKNQDCVEIYIQRGREDGKWNDEPCQKKKRALCYQASCQYSSCNQHGECVETIGNYTCDCYPGFYGPECEDVVKCQSLDPGPTCSHPLGEFSYNSTCKFQCKEGFELHGLDTLQCLASGNWTASAPECAAVRCPALAAPGRGQLNCTHRHGDFTYNSTCAFSCETGFVRKGPEMLECTALGDWTGHPPRCEAVKCPVLDSPGRGQLNCSHWHGDFTYNSTCNFSCDMGFVRNGPDTLECTALGEWTGRPPHCEAVKCPALISPGRGQLNCSHFHGDFTYNSTCTFSCETGFVQNGPEMLECTALGEWTGHLLRCEAVTCPVLTAPGRGRLNCSHWHGDFTYNSTCNFSCETGFVRNGSEMLECTVLGEWTGRPPRCEAVTCPALAAPDRGQINCSHFYGDFTYDSTCAFSCETGFVRNGSDVLECTALGEWTGRPPRCEVIRCPALATPSRGQLNCTHGHGDFTYNSTCTFSCETGFVRKGPETLECTVLGDWTGHPPLCEAVKCPVLAAPERGQLNCSHWHGEFTYDSTCIFSCEMGFVRKGPEMLECTALGKWTERPPHCEAVKCPALAAPGRGQINCSHFHGDFTYDSACTFSCEMGFVRNGSDVLECTALGEWTGRPPRCEVIRCPALATPSRGRLNCTHGHGDFTYNSTCTFSCETGFVRKGPETLECTALGDWTGHPPLCEAVKCPPLDTPVRGQLNCSHWHGEFTYDSICIFSCDMGFVLIGPDLLECTALGDWTGRPPRCEAVKCPVLAAPERGQLNCSHWHGDFMYNSTCTFSCDMGFVRNGPDVLECTALGEWTGHPPLCEVMKCPQLRGLEPILMNCSHPLGPFSYGSMCHFHCTQGYFLNGTSHVQCQPDGHWSNKMPACQEEAASYFKQVLLYTGVGAAALVALFLTGMLIALLVNRLSDKEEEKMLLNSTSDLGAHGVFTNAVYDSNL